MNWSTDIAPARIVFDEDFDAPSRPSPPAAPTEPAVPDPVALRQAYAAGLAAGRAERDNEQAEQTQAILRHVADECAAARASFIAHAEAIARELAAALLACFAHAFPALCSHHGAAEIAAIAAQIRPSLLRDPELRIFVAPAHLPMLRERLSAQYHELAEHVRLLPAPRLGPSDAILRWHKGQATREAAGLWRDIQTVLIGQGLAPAEATPRNPERRDPANVK